MLYLHAHGPPQLQVPLASRIEAGMKEEHIAELGQLRVVCKPEFGGHAETDEH
jgi:hypothetical protein